MGRRLGAIALLALLVRAVVPAGFMLASAETGEGRYLTVEFCEGHGKPAQVIDLDTGKLVDPSDLPKGDSDDGQGKAPPCVFAGAAHVAPPVVFAELAVFPAERAVVVHAAQDVRPGEGIAAPPPPSTGPPSAI